MHQGTVSIVDTFVTMTNVEVAELLGDLMETAQLCQAEGGSEADMAGLLADIGATQEYLDFEATYEAAYEAGLIVG